MDSYMFNPERAYNEIKAHWEKWAKSVNAKGWIVGISGGKDSSVVAALAAKIFGYDHVLGVLMPNKDQDDIEDSKAICKHLKIEWCTLNIGKAYEELMDEVVFGALRPYDIKRASTDTITNMPARLRMTALYAVAQSIDRIVLNTCNASEDCVGYATLYGDNAGSYAPIQGLTVTEVIALGDWLGLPHHLVHKTPIDGLQPLSDEDKLGFKYADLDRYIREDIGTPEFKEKINELYRRNKFKTDIVQIPHPNFDYLGNFVRYNNLPDAQDELQKEFDALVAQYKEETGKCVYNIAPRFTTAGDFILWLLHGNLNKFNSGDVNADFDAACKAYMEATGKTLCNCTPKYNSSGDFIVWLLSKQKRDEGLDLIRIEPELRYPEDGYINEERDDNDNPKMPFMVADEKAQDGWVWKLEVNIKTGEVIGWPKEVKADVHYKVCDCCRIKYAGKEYYEYVPNFLAINDRGYGDYIILTIEDGKIVDWSEANCREFIEKVLNKPEEEE